MKLDDGLMWVFMSYYHGYLVVVFTVFSLLFALFTVLVTVSWLVKHHFNVFFVLLYALVFTSSWRLVRLRMHFLTQVWSPVNIFISLLRSRWEDF
ncbi:hypothetical protein QOM18_25820, partial [Serratia marcescens]|uniref:hypothetical protein n=1 Tax=Serratia marcescens TaxID=615 RepID=UPI0024C4B1B6